MHSLILLVCAAAMCHLALSSSVLRFQAYPDGCKHSPSVWCGSDEVARSCGVLRQCWAAKQVRQGQAAAVNVTLYMESLCPDCKAFFSSQLYPTWQKLNSTGIVNFEVVPFGNAMESIKGHRWLFKCQHGPAECEGNQIATCAIGILRSPARWMPYLACLEQKMNKDNVKSIAESCAKSLNISYPHIDTCAHNEWGDILEHHMAERTEKLNPQHKYVPWVTVNGEHNEEIQKQAENNLLQLVCSTYKGTKPKVCSNGVSRCYRN